MSKPLSIASVIEANRLSSEVPYIPLIDLEIVDPDTGTTAAVLHIARNPEAVTFRGVTYEPGVFDIQLHEAAGETPSVSLTVNDYLQVVQAYMERYGGGVGSNITFYLISATNTGNEPEAEEHFLITAATSSEFTHNFTLGAENTLMQSFPRRRQTRDYCQWRFKSGECGYTGAVSTCDLTLQGPNGCASKGNAINFGGFPGINSNGYRYR